MLVTRCRFRYSDENLNPPHPNVSVDNEIETVYKCVLYFGSHVCKLGMGKARSSTESSGSVTVQRLMSGVNSRQRDDNCWHWSYGGGGEFISSKVLRRVFFSETNDTLKDVYRSRLRAVFDTYYHTAWRLGVSIRLNCSQSRESNPGQTNGNRLCYHYTTQRGWTKSPA